MKKFKRFLCIPLLVLFAMTLLTLPAAAAVTVLLPDGKPAASMTLTLNVEQLITTHGQAILPGFGPVEVATDANGVFAYPAELKTAMMTKKAIEGVLHLTTTSPSKMAGVDEHFSFKYLVYNSPITIHLK